MLAANMVRGTFAKRVACIISVGPPNCWAMRRLPVVPSAVNSRHVQTLRKRVTLADREADFPDVVRQWHPTKNILKPSTVAPMSRQKVWFKCDEGHEWQTSLSSRTSANSGCAMCKIKRVNSTNNLLAKHPEVAAEWHPTKNGDLLPDGVASGSNLRVWWQCKQDSTHEWQTDVWNRAVRLHGCPTCSIQKRIGKPIGKLSLLASHPDLAQEWHPAKNGDLTPDVVARASSKKVWWLCANNAAHEWEAVIASRSVNKAGCPFCKHAACPVGHANNLLALY
eukprot:Colp12_sorted_trinity150504_noHs@25626